jgi:hypothetical protein
MDDNAFAALTAAVVVSEGKIGGTATRHWLKLLAEDVAAWCGIITSGHDLEDAAEKQDWDRFFDYATNRDVPNLATVGIGNVSLDTATDIWNRQACGHSEFLPECTPVEVSALRTTNAFGFEVDIPNPYIGYACGSMGTCVSFERSNQEAYEYLAPNLLNDEVNIEYVAANLEAGALRATAKGMTPGAFNSATWHLFGIQERELIRRHFIPGPFGPMGIVRNIPTALNVLGLTSGWQLEADEEFVYWRAHGY